MTETSPYPKPLHPCGLIGLRLIAWPRLGLLCSLALCGDANAWQHLCLTEAQSREEWQIAHCTNYALKSEGAVCRGQVSPDGKWKDCPQIADGTAEIAWDVKSYPARLEVRFPRERTISAFAWWRFLNRGSDAYGPGTYSIEVSRDGVRWEPVIEKARNPWLGRDVRCFPEVKVRAIALVLRTPLMPAYPRTILLKGGVYNLAEVKAGNSVEDPLWFSDRYGYRARVSDGPPFVDKKGLCRRPRSYRSDWREFPPGAGSRQLNRAGLHRRANPNAPTGMPGHIHARCAF